MSISFTYVDHSEENSAVVFPLPAITVANFDGVLGDDLGEGKRDLTDALNAVTRGTLVKIRADAISEVVAGAPPADPDAQREDGLRIWGRGAVTQKLYSWTVPTADRSILAQPGSDEVSLLGAEMAALVTAIETHVKPSYAPGLTEDVDVTRARLIGRNN